MTKEAVGGWIGPDSPHYTEIVALLHATIDVIEEDLIAPSLSAADRAAVVLAAVANWTAENDRRKEGAALFKRWAKRLRAGQTFRFEVPDQWGTG